MKSWQRISRSLSIALMVLAAGCKEEIAHNLSEGDSYKIFSLLSDSGIKAVRNPEQNGKWSVSVDNAEAESAVRSLTDARMLQNEAAESDDSSSLLSSRQDQQFRFERGLSSAIERTLRALPGVLEARVHLNLPESDPIFGKVVEGRKGTASVLLISSEEFREKADSVRSLVSGATGIGMEGVSLLVSKENARPRTSRIEKHSSLFPYSRIGGGLLSLALILLGIGLLLKGRESRRAA